MIWQTAYQSQQNCVSWQGYCVQEGKEFDDLLNRYPFNPDLFPQQSDEGEEKR